MQTLIAYRFVVSLALSVVVGTVDLHLRPFPADNLLLALIQARRPMRSAGLSYAYARPWFSTPFFAISGVCAWLYILVIRTDRSRAPEPLSPYSVLEARGDVFLVLGEQHRRAPAARATEPRWLFIPERGLYTGLIIMGAIGTGETSACLYPYVGQLLAYSPDLVNSRRHTTTRGCVRAARPGHHVANSGARLGPVKALRYAPTPLRGAHGLDGILGRARDAHLRDGRPTTRCRRLPRKTEEES
jgi:hypothetical protein